jgi:hypothetical protein
MIVEDVELRFVEREQPRPPGSYDAGVPLTYPVRILQMRKKVHQPLPGYMGPVAASLGQQLGPAEWTEWQDVPLVKE